MFTVTAEFEGNSLRVDYKGRPYGDKITGTLKYDFSGNTGEGEFTATRNKEKKKPQETESRRILASKQRSARDRRRQRGRLDLLLALMLQPSQTRPSIVYVVPHKRRGGFVAHDESNGPPLRNLFVAMLNNMGIETESFAKALAS